GVRDSIGSDVDNVATLLRVSNLIPPAIDLKPLLAEAKTQLAEEADYIREADRMRRFAERLADDPRYVVPRPEKSLTTPLVLA
ncbi:AarF/UbiB family protein, partial [Escherichia coli]|nr:AarF/UbiB family protein [Escherichia coli]